jgi:hypothetical protein
LREKSFLGALKKEISKIFEFLGSIGGSSVSWSCIDSFQTRILPRILLEFQESFNSNPSSLQLPDEFVAQFKSTLLLLPNGTVLATGIPVDLSLYESEYSVTDEELVKLLAEDPKLVTGAAATSSSSSSKNKKKKKKPAAAAGEGANKENAAAEQKQ